MVVHYGESQGASADAAQSANQGTRNRCQDSRWERVGLQQIFEPQVRTILALTVTLRIIWPNFLRGIWHMSAIWRDGAQLTSLSPQHCSNLVVSIIKT
jgi:hypothetical protein